ncbi:outer membrane beta-barrel protein [Thiohalomonas denitrificans]|uniref:outer membrane beta-barrel protein n=1 Tax=Thiohalomonas denitrificans TaxID=415747 RepID=UPI0026E974A7|nr:outer membrane beta-barrel protein [Thiohalomonas denitrificans]
MDKKWILPVLLVFGTGTAWAQQTMDESRLYLGAGVGWADVDEPGLDDDDTGYKIFLGYRAMEWLDAEVAYTNLGDFGSIEPDGFQLSGLARFAVDPSIDIFGKAGLYAWDSSDSGLDFDDTGVDPVLGFGGHYQLDGRFGVRAEYERFYDVDDADIDLFSVSATYDF